jgi:hypothetical protein
LLFCRMVAIVNDTEHGLLRRVICLWARKKKYFMQHDYELDSKILLSWPILLARPHMNMPGRGVSPTSPRARATPMGAINEEKKKN